MIRLAGAMAVLLSMAVTAETSAAESAGVRAAPAFGNEAASNDGPLEFVVEVDNAGSRALDATIELRDETEGAGPNAQRLARAAMAIPPRRNALVRLPSRSLAYGRGPLRVVAVGSEGREIGATDVTIEPAYNPLLVELEESARLAHVLKAKPLSPAWEPSVRHGSAAAKLTFGLPPFDRASGEPLLPLRASAYAAATVVLMRTDRLARLEPTAADALVNWVLVGGTLALVTRHPDELRAPAVAALVGADVRAVPVPESLLALPALGEAAPESTPPPPEAPEAAEDAEPLLWTPTPAPPPLLRLKAGASPRIGPLAAVIPKLSGYAGGHLHSSRFGASTAYGLGQVHLLAFDPTERPMIDDEWVQARVLELVEQGWDHRAPIAFPHGSGERGTIVGVRRLLDPNEGFRVALAFATGLLVAYSIAAGPVLFLRASKRGTPLSPLKWAPLLSAAAFGGIVLLGLAAKGWSGRVRHLALVEAASDAPRGSVRRFRGFFASRTDSLAIGSTDATCLLDVVASDASAQGSGTLRAGRTEVVLENVTSLPWHTLIVREDGLFDLGEGISVRRAAAQDVQIANRSGRALANVLVYVPGIGVHLVDAVGSGATALASGGTLVLPATARSSTSTKRMRVHALGALMLGSAIGGEHGAQISEAWAAFESAADAAVDWLPDDVPVALGELAAGAPPGRDAGLRVEDSRTFFRIIGERQP